MRLNGVYSRNNLPKPNDGSNEIILAEYIQIGTHCIALYLEASNDERNLKIYRQEKYYNKYFQNVSTQLNNVWILSYCWIYWFYVKN